MKLYSKGKALIIFMVVAGLFASTAFAAVRGKELWRAQCVSCHETKNQGPKAASFYAGIQWERFLKSNRHEKIARITLSEEDKSALLEYLKAFAADSDSPEIAGIR